MGTRTEFSVGRMPNARPPKFGKLEQANRVKCTMPIPCTGGYLRAWQKNSWRRNHQQHHHHKVVNYLHYYIVQPWINYTCQRPYWKEHNV